MITHMLILGITGTLGAGKGTVVEYLAEHYGFKHFSVRSYLAHELSLRGIPVNRDTLTAFANDLRAKNSPSFIIEQLYAKAAELGKNCIIESIRTPGEIAALRNLQHFYLLAVDADPKVRYERIRLRNSETDNVSFETFMENEKREMHASDSSRQNLAECIKQADFVMYNNGNVEELHSAIKVFLQEMRIL